MKLVKFSFATKFFFISCLINFPLQAGPYNRVEAFYDCYNKAYFQARLGGDFDGVFSKCAKKMEKRFCTGQRKIPVQSFYEGIPMNDGDYIIEYYECPK